jgi:hypothetical protein
MLNLALVENGRLQGVELMRWGNPEGGAFREVKFNALIEDEATFAGYTIPTRVRVGWYLENRSFGSDGEFFRSQIDYAEYR